MNEKFVKDKGDKRGEVVESGRRFYIIWWFDGFVEREKEEGR